MNQQSKASAPPSALQYVWLFKMALMNDRLNMTINHLKIVLNIIDCFGIISTNTEPSGPNNNVLKGEPELNSILIP